MDITTANRLYELRKQHGYSQDELADKLNVSRQAISKWERSESSPDTDNLIALARLYGVSLDELLNYTPSSASTDAKKTDEQATTDGGAENSDENAQSTVNSDKNNASTFDYEENGDSVHIDENGIHVRDTDGSNIFIKGGIAKILSKVVGEIHVEDGKTTVNGKSFDNDEFAKNEGCVHIANGHISFDNKKTKNIAIASSIVNGATFPLCTLAYLLIGFLCNLWHPGWLVFFIPIIVGGTFDTIAKRNPSNFPVVFIVTAVYLLLGCGYGLWHPYWALFCIIPAYYAVVEPVKAAVKKKQKPIFDINFSDNSSSDFDENSVDAQTENTDSQND